MRGSLELVGEVYFAALKSINTPRALTAWLLFKHGEHRQLADLELNPKGYESGRVRVAKHDFAGDLLATELLSKSIDLRVYGDSGDVERKCLATANWKLADQACRETNSILRMVERGGLQLPPRVEAVMFTATRKIANLLGDVRVTLFESCGWGPGVTTSLRGDKANLDNKIGEYPIHVSSRGAQYLRAVIEQDIHWLQAWGIPASGPCCLLDGWAAYDDCCSVTTVPKNAKTDRVIAIEPTGNLFLQKAVGKYLRGRLKRVGIDLDSQRPNQMGAARAFHDRLATIDLKAASDTISTQLVKQLLPYDWWVLLDDLRSHTAEFDGGETILLEKFSSMGNGFTFELETLIFWALAQATEDLCGTGSAVLVYGDDIIASEMCTPVLMDVFRHVGFTTNVKKTHFESPYRESCGMHYFGGIDVTPIYQKESIGDLPSAIRLANRITRLCLRRGFDTYLDGTLRAAFEAARSIAEDFGLRQYTPLGSEDDDGLLVSFDELIHRATPAGHGLWKCDVLSFRASRRKGDHSALLAYWFRFPGALLDESGRVTRRRRGKYVSRRRLYLVGLKNVRWV